MRYIGSKKLLLPEIKKLLDKHVNGTEKVFLDLFAGTTIEKECCYVTALNYNHSSHNTKAIGSREVLITNYKPKNLLI